MYPQIQHSKLIVSKKYCIATGHDIIIMLWGGKN